MKPLKQFQPKTRATMISINLLMENFMNGHFKPE